jgi:hypothetical protein
MEGGGMNRKRGLSQIASATTIDDSDKIRRGDIIWLYRQPMIVTIHILGGVLALMASEDVLSSTPWLREIVSFMSTWVPIISNSARYSSFPEVTQLYGAAMLSTSPYWLYVSLQWPDWEKSVTLMLETATSTASKIIMLHILPVIALLGLYVYFFKVGLTDLTIAPFHHSRWALAMVGPVFYCWTVSGGYAAVVVPTSALIRFWKDK